MNRPLSERQIIYAATDAYCLLQIYNKYEDMFKNSPHCKTHLSFLEFYKKLVCNKNRKKRTKRRKRKNRKRN